MYTQAQLIRGCANISAVVQGAQRQCSDKRRPERNIQQHNAGDDMRARCDPFGGVSNVIVHARHNIITCGHSSYCCAEHVMWCTDASLAVIIRGRDVLVSVFEIR